MAEAVVITGGNGFVGRYLVDELRREEPDSKLVVWDQQVDGLPKDVEGVVVDITDPKSYRASLRSTRPAWLVHLAAITSIPAALADPAHTFRVNAVATRQLLEEVRRISEGTKLLVISSADIYGLGSATPLSELPLAEARPRNPYARSKWEMEQVIEEQFSEQTLRVRPFAHIGPGQRQGFVVADFAAQVAVIEAGRQKPVIRVGNLEARRDFTDVRDVVRAYRLLMRNGVFGEACLANERKRGVCGVYHVASGRAVSISHILDTLLEQASVEIAVEQDPARLRPVDVPVVVGDATKLRQLTGWQPEIPLARSLNNILAWWREHSEQVGIS